MFQLHLIQDYIQFFPIAKLYSLQKKCVKAMADCSFRLYTVGVSQYVYALDMYYYRSW